MTNDGASRTGREWEGVSRRCSEGLGGVRAVGAVGAVGVMGIMGGMGVMGGMGIMGGVGIMERLPQSQRVGAAGYVNTN